MKTTIALLRHHIERMHYGAKYSALVNCHVRGLTSIVLHDEPENRVRLFIADGHHQLWRSDLPAAGPMSLAVHPHHCDVRFVGLLGNVENLVCATTPNPTGDWTEFEYRSAITQGTGSFTRTGNERADMHLLKRERMADCPTLRANQLHTVFVSRGFPAAWLVIEGREDPKYSGLCWSNTEPVIDGDFYQPLDNVQAANCLAWVLGGLE